MRHRQLWGDPGLKPLDNPQIHTENFHRVESDVHESREESNMWLVRHLEILRQVVVEDLLVAKFVCRYSFPPSYNIFDKYVIWYHEALSLHVSLILINFSQHV